MAGLIDSVKRGVWQIAPEGRALLKEFPNGIPESRLHDVRRAALEKTSDEEAPEQPEPATEDATPVERLRAAHAEIEKKVIDDLLTAIRQGSPDFFERVVLHLLQAMGYGAKIKISSPQVDRVTAASTE